MPTTNLVTIPQNTTITNLIKEINKNNEKIIFALSSIDYTNLDKDLQNDLKRIKKSIYNADDAILQIKKFDSQIKQIQKDISNLKEKVGING